MTAFIRFENIDKAFGRHAVYEGLSLNVSKGETLSVLGGSGTGKSVLLKTLIGLLRPDNGRVIFDGEDVSFFDETQWRALRRRVGMVFQGAALFDSMSVFDNIAYPIRLLGKAVGDEELQEKVREKLDWVSLSFDQVAHLKPAELSGGMAKRVGLARAIATEPDVILWDEPTTGLDPKSRRAINTLIVSMQKRLGATSMVVTHDLASAFAVSNRLALLSNKRIVAVGTEAELRACSLPEVTQFLDERVLEG